MKEIKKVIEIAEEIDKLGVESSKLSWVQYTTGYDFGVMENFDKMNKIFQDKSKFQTILDYKEKQLSPENKRRIKLIYNAFESYHLTPELNKLREEIHSLANNLSQLLNTHRSQIDGKDIASTEIQRILAEDPNDTNRKKAYLATTQINKPLIDAGFIELLNLRKEYAKLYGAEDYVELSLKDSELSTNIFSSWTNEVKSKKDQLQKISNEYAQKYLNKDILEKWDGAFISGKIAPLMESKVNIGNFYEATKKLFLNFGIDISKDNATYDIFPRKNKSEWGYSFPIERGKDNRVLANVKDKYNEFNVLLHETGHSMHFLRTDSEDIIMNYGISGIIEEGIANLFGGMISEELFYKDFFKSNLKDAKQQFEQLEKNRKLTMLKSIPTILFDQELYKRDIKTLDDINQLKFNFDKELLGIEPHEDEPQWGHLIHHTTHPIYLHNYFMGDVTCEMLKGEFCKKQNISKFTDNPKEFGDFLMEEIIKPGGKYTFEELFKRISGNDFSLKYITD